MNLEFDKLNIEERPTIVLETLNFEPIAVMGDAYGLSANIKYNEVSEIEFTIPHYVDGVENTFFDDVASMRIAHIADLGRFRLVSPQNTIDGVSEVKVCKGYSLECELSYKTINLAQGTYNLWNPNNYGNTIIGMFLADFPAWRVNMMDNGTPLVEVDTSLYDKYRTFEVSDNWYNFLKSTAQQAYQCVFEFDPFNRVMSVRAAKEGASHKSVFIASDNLAKEIQVEELTDEIITCFDVYGASDVDIRTVNPTGTNKIYDLSYYMKDDKNFSMPSYWWGTETIDCSYLSTDSPDGSWTYDEEIGSDGIISMKFGSYKDFLVEGITPSSKISLASNNSGNCVKVEALDRIIRVYTKTWGYSTPVSTEHFYVLHETYIQNPDITLAQKYQMWSEAIESARDTYYSYSMRRANIYVEYEAAKAEYTELQSEYTKYENLFSAAAQAESAKIEVKTSSSKYRQEIKDTYALMVDKAQEITAIENRLKELQDQLDAISNNLAFEKYFTEEELIILAPYVKESVMSESTFVAANTAVYGESGALLKGLEHSICITKAPVVDCTNSTSDNGILSTESSILTYRADGGQVKISYPSGGELLEITGSVQRAVYNVSEGKDKDGNPIYKLVGSIVFQKDVVNDDGTTNTVTATLTIVKDEFNKDKLVVETTYDYGAEINEDEQFEGFMKIENLEGATVYLTGETTEFQRNSVQWELYDYAWELLGKSAAPSYSFSANVANFLTLEDFEMFKNQLALGERVYLQLREGYVLEPVVIGVSFEYDDPTSMSLEFANQFNSNSGEFGLLDILEQSVSLGSTVDTSRFTWQEWSNGASTVVDDYMNSELNAAKQRLIGASGQATSFDGSGLHLRKYKDNNTEYAENAPDIVRNSEYDPKQAWLTHDGLMFTDDGWESVRMAIGLHSNGNYGIIADELVGKVLIGNSLFLSLGSSDDFNNPYVSINEQGLTVNSAAFRVLNLDNTETDLNDLINSAGTTSYKSATPPEDPKVGDLWFCYASDGETVAFGYEDGKWYRYAGTVDYPTHDEMITEYEELLEAITAAQTDVTNGVEGADSILTAAQKALADYNAELKSIFGSAVNDLDLVNGTRDEQVELINALPENYGVWELLEEQVGLDHVSGTVSTTYTLDEMTSTSGNLYMGDSGLWLINTPDPTTATKAVWVNGSGVLVGNGRGDSNYTEDPSYKDGEALDWTTAISADGVYATEFVGESIFGNIALGVGDPETEGNDSSRPFYVDNEGNFTATSADIKGTIRADKILIGDDNIKDLLNYFQPVDDNLWVTGCGLKIGENPNSSNGYNFYVDSSGNLTLSGSITWGASSSPVQVLYGREAYSAPTNSYTSYPTSNLSGWHRTMSSSDLYASYTYDGGSTWTSAIKVVGEDGANGEDGSDASVPTYIKDSFINEANILSPSIYGGHFYATGKGADSGAAYYISNGMATINTDTGTFTPNDPISYISYDTNGSGGTYESKDRVIFHSDIAMRIESKENMSLSAENIYTPSPFRVDGTFSALGKVVLGTGSYGSRLPDSGTTGQIFFLKA